MSMDVNEDIKNAIKAAHVYDKPPLGAPPYWFAAGDRVDDLASAILRRSDNMSQYYQHIRRWAEEIIMQCDLVEQIKGLRYVNT